MVTNNSNTSKTQILRTTKKLGVAIAVLVSVFASNLQAARGNQRGGSGAGSGRSGSINHSSMTGNRGMGTQNGRSSTGSQTSRRGNDLNATPGGRGVGSNNGVKGPGRGPGSGQGGWSQSPRRGPGHGGDFVRSHSRIHADRFRAHFGRQHWFRINHPMMVGGYPRFVFGGVSFGLVDPWPPTWFYTDAVYVENIDGDYYLINPARPGFRVAIAVV